MAEETLVKELLTEEMKLAGAELTRKLDEAEWPVLAAFWYFVPSENQWKLMLASPKVETDGPRNAYEIISKALSTIPGHFGGIGLISVVSPKHDLVQTLASTIQTGPSIGGIRVFQRMVNGHFVDDAYIYRISLESAAA
jgi:hypothetical protein